jgi:hypothetical protein
MAMNHVVRVKVKGKRTPIESVFPFSASLTPYQVGAEGHLWVGSIVGGPFYRPGEWSWVKSEVQAGDGERD